MTRKQLVNGLRALHEDSEIKNVRFVKRTGAFIIDFYDHHYHPLGQGQLIIVSPNATEQRLQTKPK